MNSDQADVRRRPLQPVRLGFDQGWLRLNPSFLNLGIAGLLVDSVWTGRIDGLGFDVLGDRDPRHPLPLVPLVADVRLPWSLTLRTESSPDTLATCAFDCESGLAWSTVAQHAGQIALFVGDSYRVQLSWAAIFDCAVGRVATMSSQTGLLRSGVIPAYVPMAA